MVPIRRVLYPTDFSSYSNQAYFHAVALAEVHGATLVVGYVLNPSLPEMKQDLPAARRYWREQLEQISPSNPDIAVEHVFMEGDPATEITRFARDSAIDLIVMGTHGRTGVDRLLLGSVTEMVMREALCSVLAVKLPKGLPATAQPDVELSATL
jgi:nucleotide-binding universal stress UspA family protein